VTQEDNFSWPSGARGLSGPHGSPWSRPPSPLRRLQKVSPGVGRSKPTPSDTQSVRTEQRGDAQASLAPRYLDGPWHTATSPSWTLVHVDHRLEPPNRLVPDLTHYIRDKVGPRGGMIPVRSPNTPFHSICLRSTPRARQPGEEHREPLLYHIPLSPSSPMRGRLHRRQGNLMISTELTPLQNLLHLRSVVTPRFWVLLSIKIISY
jgi:hypothetical protein